MNAVVEEKKTHSLAVMDRTGDTKTVWDPTNADEVENAKATFDRFKKKGYLIYHVKDDGKNGVAMDKFDSSASRMVAVPAIVGG